MSEFSKWHRGGNQGLIIYDANGMPVANATVHHAKAQPETAQKNAALIARAPDLMKALEWALSRVPAADHGSPDFKAAQALLLTDTELA